MVKRAAAALLLVVLVSAGCNSGATNTAGSKAVCDEFHLNGLLGTANLTNTGVEAHVQLLNDEAANATPQIKSALVEAVEAGSDTAGIVKAAGDLDAACTAAGYPR